MTQGHKCWFLLMKLLYSHLKWGCEVEHSQACHCDLWGPGQMLYLHVPSSIACGDPDAEPGARMTCRLLLHLFRTPQVCLFPQGTGKCVLCGPFISESEPRWFLMASDFMCENIHSASRNDSWFKLIDVSLVKSWYVLFLVRIVES